MNISNTDSFIVIYTEDISKVVSFYQALGIAVSDVSDTNATVQLGGHEMHFVLSSSEPNNDYEVAISKIPTPTNTIYYVETADIASALKEVKKSEAMICAEPYNNSWGAQEFLLKDPAGTFVALYQML